MDKEILVDLKGENNGAFGELYKLYFDAVDRFVRNNSGNEADAEDVFQDSMVVLLEKLRQDDFRLTASVKTYILAIAKHIWFNRLRRGRKETALPDNLDESYLRDVQRAIDAERSFAERLQSYITSITDHCQRLIQDMFFDAKPIEQIQREYGYANRHTAINQKHKCVEQIRKVKDSQSRTSA